MTIYEGINCYLWFHPTIQCLQITFSTKEMGHNFKFFRIISIDLTISSCISGVHNICMTQGKRVDIYNNFMIILLACGKYFIYI